MIWNIIIGTLFIVAFTSLFIYSRRLYYRSIRMRNRAQMNDVFTNIAHELLTPLTVISASVDRLRGQEPKFMGDYDLMQLNIERMVRLLQQILETSKSQAGELKLLVAKGDVMQYIQQTALSIEPLMAKRGLEFTIHCTPESMMGWIDTDKLDKIIYNLLSNAAKYTGENGRVQLQVRTNKRYDHVIIRVSDNGIGIPPNKMKHLFQRFYDGDYRYAKTLGTGIGLALTRDLVYLHGGTIECESKEGVGTTFTVVLPIDKKSFSASQIDERNRVDISQPTSAILDIAMRMRDQTQVADEEEEMGAGDDADRLLVVEDNIELLMLMRQLLSQKYNVLTASNGAEAMEIIRKNPLDLIISDVMMPVMNGRELTAAVKRTPEFSHLPVILLTAKTQDEDREDALLVGADDYVTKPFKMRDLELRINNLIENRKRIQREALSESLGELSKPVVPHEPTPEELFLKKAVECVHAHLDDSDYDRDLFATDMGVSTSTLYNKLRSLTGLSVSYFIRDIRLKEAKSIMERQPTVRISELAYRVGFRDPKYFATCFKKEYGVQPSEYVENLAKDQET